MPTPPLGGRGAVPRGTAVPTGSPLSRGRAYAGTPVPPAALPAFVALPVASPAFALWPRSPLATAVCCVPLPPALPVLPDEPFGAADPALPPPLAAVRASCGIEKPLLPVAPPPWRAPESPPRVAPPPLTPPPDGDPPPPPEGEPELTAPPPPPPPLGALGALGAGPAFAPPPPPPPPGAALFSWAAAAVASHTGIASANAARAVVRNR